MLTTIVAVRMTAGSSSRYSIGGYASVNFRSVWIVPLNLAAMVACRWAMLKEAERAAGGEG